MTTPRTAGNVGPDRDVSDRSLYVVSDMTDPMNIEAVYRELAPGVLGYLRSHRVDAAEDVLGDVFLHVVRDIDRFKGDRAALRRWVFSIAHNRMVDHFRKQRRTLETPVAELRDAGADPVVPMIDPELVDALGQLASAQREVLVLRFVADLSIEDVARVLRRTNGAVKALQSRGLTRLESILADRSRRFGTDD